MPDQDDDRLPQDVAIMVVDTKGFSQHNDAQQDELSPLIPEILERACDRSGLEELWEGRRFPDGTGDGYMIGFTPALLPRVVDRYFDALQEELSSRMSSLKSRDMRLRMRLSLHVGPVRELHDSRIDSPVGEAMIGTHRLVDLKVLRKLLDRSDEDVTLLAVTVSERVMQDVISSGRTRRRKASEFVGMPVTIPEKKFTATAYLHVPAMSGDLLRFGLAGVQTEETRQESDTPPKARPVPPVARAGRDIDQSTRSYTAGRDQYTAHRDMSIRQGHDR